MYFLISRRLDAARPAVFDVISDPRYRMEWQSSLLSLQTQMDASPRLGTRWRETTKGGVTFELEITTFEPPHRWGEEAHSRVADAALLVEFFEMGQTTRVDVGVTISFKGAFKALTPLVRLFMPMAFSKDLARAAALARGRGSPPSLGRVPPRADADLSQ